MSKKLTPKQKRFCQEYVTDLNATQAAIRTGYSEKTAEVQGSTLLRNPKVKKEIERLKAKRADKVEIKSEDVLRRLKEYYDADISKFMNLTFDEVKELPLELRRMISGFKKTISKYGITYEISFIDKMKALEMINRHIGFYEKDNSQRKNEITVFEIPKNDRDEN